MKLVIIIIINKYFTIYLGRLLYGLCLSRLHPLLYYVFYALLVMLIPSVPVYRAFYASLLVVHSQYNEKQSFCWETLFIHADPVNRS
jgi:hypothetical protein